MNIHDSRSLQLAADEAVRKSQGQLRKMILVHTGVSVGLALLLSLLDHFLDTQIESTGGLGGVGTRAILETVQTVLFVAQVVALLFWQIGYVYIGLRVSRGQSVEMGDLLQGFRKFGPVLRLRILTSMLMTGMAVLCAYVASIALSLTPFSDPLMEAMESGTEEALSAAMEQMMLPMSCAVGVFLLIIFVPFWYRLRMADYVLMDHDGVGAFRAVGVSKGIMRHNRLALLKLDLHYWWFYLGELLGLVVAYGDLILPQLGLNLPWTSTVSYYIFLVLSQLLQLVLYWWKGNNVRVAYANFYNVLMSQETV